MSICQRFDLSFRSIPMLAQHCQDARSVWNIGLEHRNLWQPNRTRKITTVTQTCELAEARKAFLWPALGSFSLQQAALSDLDLASKNWWGNLKHCYHPTWRKAGQNESFYVRDLSLRRLSRNWGEVLVRKTGWFRFRLTRPWPEIEASTSARITLDLRGRWHTSFTQPQPEFQRDPTGAAVGLDMRIASTVTTSYNPGKNERHKAGLNRSIHSRSWSAFRKRLGDKAASAVSPVELVAVNPRVTSQTCPRGHRAAQNRKGQAFFACITYGYEANADLNAARNILAARLAVAGRRGTPQAKPNRAKRGGPVKRQPPPDRWHELRFLVNPSDLSVRRRPTSEI